MTPGSDKGEHTLHRWRMTSHHFFQVLQNSPKHPVPCQVPESFVYEFIVGEKESSWRLPRGTKVPISRCPGLESREKPSLTGLGRSVLNPPLSEPAGSSDEHTRACLPRPAEGHLGGSGRRNVFSASRVIVMHEEG